MKKLTQRQIKQFQERVYAYYDQKGRSFPWRRTTNPYRIFISELMLQQTQTDRVVEYYKKFLNVFPTVHDLAQATLGEVLLLWQGLGYNRRAKFLHNASQTVVTEYNGRFPKTYEELQKLPGIGPYTAAAIATFAYNQPHVVIETNIRAVFLYEYFTKDTNDLRRDTNFKIDDKEIIPLIEQTLDYADPRKWYNALMDYGAMLKKEHPNPTRKSKHYTKQSQFKGSNREVRGAIIRLLTEVFELSKKGVSKKTLYENLSFEPKRIEQNLAALVEEGMIQKYRNSYRVT